MQTGHAILRISYINSTARELMEDLKTNARMLSIVATSGCWRPVDFSRSSIACLHSGMATS